MKSIQGTWPMAERPKLVTSARQDGQIGGGGGGSVWQLVGNGLPVRSKIVPLRCEQRRRRGLAGLALQRRQDDALYNGVRNGDGGRQLPASPGKSIFLIMHRYDY